MLAIQDIISSLTAPFQLILNLIITNGLGMFAAAAVIIVGYLVGSALGFVVSLILDKSKVDKHIEHLHVHDAIGFVKFHELIGLLIKWYVVALFVVASSTLIPAEGLSSMILSIGLWVPNFLLAIAIFFAGLVFADFVHRHFMIAKTHGLRLVGSALKASLILMSALIALDQMGLQIDLASNVLLVVIGGLVLTISIALGISLGYALKDDAKTWVKFFVKK